MSGPFKYFLVHLSSIPEIVLTRILYIHATFCLPSKDLKLLDSTGIDTELQTSQCTKIGEHGEMITVSITTEESHRASVLGKF